MAVESRREGLRAADTLSRLEIEPSDLLGREDDLAAIRSIVLGGRVRLLTLTDVFNKLGVDTRAHAVAVAAQRGLLTGTVPVGAHPPVR